MFNTNKTPRVAKFAAIATAVMLTAGAVVASAQRGPGFGGPKMSAALNLTDAQKEQAKAIFSGSREQSKALREQARASRAALEAAAKAGKPDSELERLAAEQGVLAGQMAAIHAKSMAKFWTLLTPEQKAKAQELRANRKERGSQRGERSRERRG